MDQALARYVRISGVERDPRAPHLSLDIEDVILSQAERNGIFFTFRRPKDGYEQPVIFSWLEESHIFGPEGWIILQHTPTGLVKVNLELQNPPPEKLEVSQRGGCFLEVFPDKEVDYLFFLPHSYWDLLQVGERYEFVWPGLELPIWEWGTIKDNEGRVLEADPRRPRLVIPGSHLCSLTVIEEERVFPKAPPSPPVEPESREPGAPILDVTLECPPMISMSTDSRIVIPITVTYTGAPTTETGRPIVFYIRTFIDDTRDYRFNKETETWERCSMCNGDGASAIYDEPDSDHHVATHKHFVSLQPRESWSRFTNLSFMWELPENTKVGDVFRYRYIGGTVDWWDWGDLQDHRDTVVTLHCWDFGKVVKPRDNDGRPRLVVPASNVAEFRVVE